MVGLDVLARFVVELDFAKKSMVLTDRARPPTGAVRIPMEPMGLAFGVHVEINGVYPLTAMLDTGANCSVSLNEADWNAAFSAEERAGSSSTVFAATGGQVVTSRMIRIRLLKMGSEQYQDLVCTLISRNAPPSIGLPLLKQHHVIFDFPGKTLFLSERRSTRDENDMSGLHLLKIDGNVVVYSVDERSPAAQAGILPNDIIVSIDEMEAAKTTMNALRQRLTNADGASRLIVIERNGKLLRVNVQLQRRV
jgi:membrane-associated protease RseP (regulator of RpoE activity)